MNPNSQSPAKVKAAQPGDGKPFLITVAILAALLLVLLHRVLAPDTVMFSNDGPLGRLMAQCHEMPARFTSCWEDLNGVGTRGGPALLNISGILHLILSPEYFAKFYAPITLLLLGVSAFFCLRQLGLGHIAAGFGAVAAMLNSAFFSTACWGMGAHVITVACSFAAVGLLARPAARKRWARVMLAGVAVGLGVTEGADVGAMFSVFVAGFVIYRSLMTEGNRAREAAAGLGRVALVAACAGFFATQAILELVSDEITGVVGTEQDADTKTRQWDWATQWSLPKAEALSLVVPGLFGYRMSADGGDIYWGDIGRDPDWERYYANGRQGPKPAGELRYSGGGAYLGVPVAVLAVWAALQSLRGNRSVFGALERKMIWFWLGTVIVSLLLAFGRFAPFYRVLYALPYASTVRNPVKFLHVLTFGVLVLFAYGVEALRRRYMASARGRERLEKDAARVQQSGAFEKNWVRGCVIALALSLIGWFLYALGRDSLEEHLGVVSFGEAQAHAIAQYSVAQVKWFVLGLGFTFVFMRFAFRGAFAQGKAKWGIALLGLLIVVDLVRADLPWPQFWNVKSRYASNPIFDLLRVEPYQHRVAIVPAKMEGYLNVIEQLYNGLWLGELFPYYNIQSLNMVQMSRMPADLASFYNVLDNPKGGPRTIGRRLAVTNTRYLLGPAQYLEAFNSQVDPDAKRFRIVERFEVVPKPGITSPKATDDFTVAVTPTGTFALMEFTGTLPRAALYSQWLVESNNDLVLQQLANPAFDLSQTVFVASALPSPESAAGVPPGTVRFEDYKPKDILLEADAPRPSVLLLNDRYDPGWVVYVDGEQQPVLRCNQIMRGVFVGAGSHRVEFCFTPRLWPFYVSVAAVASGFLLLGIVVATGSRGTQRRTASAAAGPSSIAAPARLHPKP